jgi:DNA-directed RNA polymerase subunit RPC12/RpoP
MTGYQSKKDMAQDKLTAEPVCPECKAKVLYECVACSSNNYPSQPAQEPVACIVKGYLYMAHEFMSEIPEGATLLYTTPPAAKEKNT